MQLSSDLQGLRTVNLIVPSVFLAVAALILDVLMVRVAQQQRTTVGMLKATGYSNTALLLHFVKYGVVVGAAGGIAGRGLRLLAGRLHAGSLPPVLRILADHQSAVSDDCAWAVSCWVP